jgi:hypothetical protein
MRARAAVAATAAALLLAACGSGSDSGRGDPDAPPPGASSATATGPDGAGTSPGSEQAAGSGGAGGPTAGVDPRLAQALTRTRAAGTARTAVRIDVRGSARSTSLSGQGVSDFKRGRAQATFSAPGGQGRLEAVFDGGVVYQRLPGLSAAGKPWIKLDLTKVLGQSGAGGLGLSNDPTQALRSLRGLSQVREVGADTVRGAPARHYQATLDLQQAAEALPAQARAAYRRLLAAQGSTRQPADLWIDGRGRLVRLRTSTADAAPGGAGVASTVTTEYWDFGAPADIRIPAPSQVQTVG